MSIVFNRNQPGDYRRLSARTRGRDKWDATNWLYDPDLSAFRGVPLEHLQVVAGQDRVELRPQADRDSVDAVMAAQELDRMVGKFDDRSLLRALALELLSDINQRAADQRALMNAIRDATNLADLRTRVAAIDRPSNRTPAALRAAIRTRLDS